MASVQFLPLWPFRALQKVAQAVGRLDVVRMVIPPRPSHCSWLDVIGDNFIAITKGLVADAAPAFLGSNFSGEESAHLRRRPKLPVTAGMVDVFDELNTGA